MGSGARFLLFSPLIPFMKETVRKETTQGNTHRPFTPGWTEHMISPPQPPPPSSPHQFNCGGSLTGSTRESDEQWSFDSGLLEKGAAGRASQVEVVVGSLKWLPREALSLELDLGLGHFSYYTDT